MPIFAALSAATIHEMRATASSGNVNGGGFNPTNANFLTDFTTDTNTGNTDSAVISSASYNFVAGDDEAWVYIQAGTNWYNGCFFQIDSVGSNKATLNSGIGEGSCFSTTFNKYIPNTVVGVASVATPTGGTLGFDFSQQDVAEVTATDYTSVGASTTLTSVTGGFRRIMTGNIFHITTTGTAAHCLQDWTEVVSVTDANTIVTDRTTNDGTACVAGTGFLGGALSLNTASAVLGDDDMFEAAHGNNVAGNTWFWRSGAFTQGEAIAISLAGTAAAPIKLIGYTSIRGDTCTGTNRPSIAGVALGLTTAAFYILENFIYTTTNSAGLSPSASRLMNSKSTNSATGTGGEAITAGSNSEVENCEAISYRGNGIEMSGGSQSAVRYCWAHDSDVGFNLAAAAEYKIINSISSSNVTAAIRMTATNTSTHNILGNTLYGSEDTTGIGFSLATGVTRPVFLNNIVYGFTTGVSHADAAHYSESNYNDYYNNDTPVTNWPMGFNEQALNPTFTNVTQLKGTSATSATNVLTMSGATDLSGVLAGRDHVYLSAGTGTGIALNVYGITAVNDGADTLTLTSNITSSGAGTGITWQITLGNNFAIGTPLKALGFPGAFQAGFTTGYMDIGAVQRQEAGSSSGFAYSFME